MGAVTGGLVIAKHGSILKDCPGGTCPAGSQSRFQGEIDSYHLFGTLSTAGFVAGGVLAATGIVQTVPTLALLVFMIPLFGIGSVPAIVAMSLYGLLPIVRNTHAGLPME